MLSIETEARICKLFLIWAELESSTEISRRNWMNNKLFDPYKIFKRLDQDNKNYIVDTDVLDFLQTNSVHCSEREAKFFIMFYDSDNCNCWNYSQFLNFILASVNTTIKSSNSKLNLFYVLPYEIEYTVCRIFEKELEMLRSVDSLIQELQRRKDFSVFDTFRSMKGGYDAVSIEILRRFFLRNNIIANDNELKNIMKKWDIDRNGYVTQSDLERIFNFNIVYSRGIKAKNAIHNPNVTSKTWPPEEMKAFSDNLTLRKIPERTPNHTYSLYDSHNMSPNEFINSISNIRIRYNISNNPLNTNTEIFWSFLRWLMDVELTIERCKVELSIRSDFNIFDLLTWFESPSSDPSHRYITELDFKRGLNELQIFPSADDLKLLMRKYDLSNNGVLCYSDVFDMFVPFEREYRSEVEERKENPFGRKKNKGNVFLKTTSICLSNWLNIMIDSERRVERQRLKISKLFSLNIREFYNKIDKDNKGSFNIFDWDAFFKQYEITFIQKEIDLLFIRFDRRRKGNVEIDVFLDEMIPRKDSFDDNYMI